VENERKKSQGVGGGEKKGKMTLRKWEAKENNKVARNKEGMQIDFFCNNGIMEVGP
jgi:hypothetical protein